MGPSTNNGVELTVVLPTPSSPSAFRPQQYKEELSRIAQVWVYPASKSVTFLPVGRFGLTGEALGLLVPSPRFPTVLYPQQYMEELSRIEQVWKYPKAISMAFLFPGKAICIGVELYVAAPLPYPPNPSWPWSLAPQQYIELLSNIAQAC